MFNTCKSQRDPRRGQSTVEYILLVTAVVAVAILFLGNKDGGLQKHLNTSLTTVSTNMTDMASRLRGSTPKDTSTEGSKNVSGIYVDVRDSAMEVHCNPNQRLNVKTGVCESNR